MLIGSILYSISMDRFFRFFESFAKPFELPDPGRPPAGGIAFIKHFAKQVKSGFLAMLILGGLTAFVEAALFVFVGKIVDMMNDSTPTSFINDNWQTLVAMAVLVAVVRVLIAIGTAVVEEQIVVPSFFTLIRWQSHRTIARQDISFFDDQLAGKVSTKVWQTGHAVGDVMISLLQIIWFITVFATTTLIIVAGLNWRMLVPVVIWLAVVGLIARHFVPRIRDVGRSLAEITTVLTGRMVDGYSNIRTIKLYGAENTNDEYIKETFVDTLAELRRFTRIVAAMRISNQTFSSFMLVVIAGMAIWFYTKGVLTAGEVAIIMALCLRLNLLLGRLLGLLNGLFRNFGTVQNSAEMISKKPLVNDTPDATVLPVAKGNVEFNNLRFSYGGSTAVIDDLNLKIPAGQKVGIVGQSGVGKTTLMNLLLRFHDVNGGTISIDGTNISTVTQHSLRAQMGIVSQDTALLHRSIKDNIAYGREGVTDAEIERAAKRAKAHDFIAALEDVRGRKGYDTFVGERGVKLSGGQRQRIALARVFLKDAPILLLDEATSALDSEVEAAIQEHLEELMKGKTVIAIAHRLSTIAHLDRLIVMEGGRIVEDGNHKTLLASGGQYARLWKRQSGGFLPSKD
ncbi:MAG: ABC transporter ATP-binding protein [Rhizobiaceae bacterium]